MVRLSDLTFGYKNQPTLFNGLDLQLEAGHIYGLLGKNGVGKTTLLKNMIGLCYPTSGQATLGGVDVTKRRPDLLSQVFFLPEEPFIPDMTAKTFLKTISPFYPNFDRLQFQRYQDDFEVPLERVLTKLSLGQQKKFMVAFGLACRTALLVMDEPTNGLDIPSKVQFRKVLAAAVDDERCVVLSTHQVRDLDSLIDSVVVLHDGQIKLHISLDRLTERIRFGKILGTSNETLLYGEEAFDGVHAILSNPEGIASRPDLELLFNAVISNSAVISDYLTTEAKQ
ncbi:ABC transporter ATP-binding protein [Parapedobacter indicus]|uniref:ABC-2 type transport system ATP-binding protein n=1 Tax=Parapedobacter indicus TaxID=1477437 RepID=A0A1I3IJK5_9SPHI|nr:ABC transporter ATP-binding protein [Parapedobacter indicus]PPL02194.1 ABC-2 type transport system ATP-binding protein [Parapedobacter indicus]SFI48101.1 ABC-2 type transport system ATP-binding protein [Parapedobacter indicus]